MKVTDGKITLDKKQEIELSESDNEPLEREEDFLVNKDRTIAFFSPRNEEYNKE